MEAIMDLNLNPSQTQMINACRMYLRVNMLAKITNHTGKCLLPDATSCSKNQPPKGLQDISQSLLDWPTIHLPSQSCWKVWICTIKSLFTGDTKGKYLQTPLGIWLEPYQRHRFWKWHVSPLGSLLYQNNLSSRPQAAILLNSTRQYATYSITVPTNQLFSSSPITPSDQQHCQINFLVTALESAPQSDVCHQHFRSLVQQFRSTLQHWQRPLFGPIT